MKRIMWLLPVFALIVGCGGEDDSYFPLSVGNEWTYDMTLTMFDQDTTVETGSQVLEITEETTLDNGTEVFTMVMTIAFDDTLIPGDVDTNYLEETDDYILVYNTLADTVPVDTLLAFPLEVGKVWDSYEVTDQVDVNVPAGQFGDCWEVYDETEDAYFYWKSGVGMVRMIDDDVTWSMLMELADYTVN